MGNLNERLNVVSRLINQCEQSDLVSFGYQDSMFSIDFSKMEMREGYTKDMVQNIILEDTFVGDKDGAEIELNEHQHDNIITIVSPFVGVIEYSKELKSDNDNNISIEKGDVLCYIEAMKIYNDIKAPVTGVIVEKLVEDYSLVEYEQPILKVKVDVNEENI